MSVYMSVVSEGKCKICGKRKDLRNGYCFRCVLKAEREAVE